MPTLSLPCGVQVGPGRVEKIIEVRKLSAKIQRDATSAEGKKNPALVNDALIMSNVLKLGTNSALSSLKNDMLMSDRAWLSSQLRKITFGPTFKGTYSCQLCLKAGRSQKEAEMVHTFNIDDIPVKGLDEAEQLWWDGENAFKLEGSPADPAFEDLRKKAKTRVFAVADDRHKIDAIFRYPNGNDERKIAPLWASEPPQLALGMHELICRCLMRYNQTPRPRGQDGFGLDFFDELDLDVAMKLEDLFKEGLPGIQEVQEIECQSGHLNALELKSVDFLAPSASTA